MRFTSILLFIFFFQTLLSQGYQFTYDLVAHLDSSSLDKFKREKMLLTVDPAEKTSVFISQNNFKMDSILKLVGKGLISEMEAISNIKKYPRTSFHFKVFKNLEHDTLLVQDKIDVEIYEYKEAIKFNWKLHEDTLTINTFKCNKATTEYLGRRYISWYTNSVPISEGPYKFKGLPGIIVKIHDETNSFDFTLAKISKINGKIDTSQSASSFEVTPNAFFAKRKEYFNNPIPLMESYGVVLDTQTKKLIRERFRKKNNFIERIP